VREIVTDPRRLTRTLTGDGDPALATAPAFAAGEPAARPTTSR
jgi:hypothetical protein